MARADFGEWSAAPTRPDISVLRPAQIPAAARPLPILAIAAIREHLVAKGLGWQPLAGRFVGRRGISYHSRDRRLRRWKISGATSKASLITGRKHLLVRPHRTRPRQRRDLVGKTTGVRDGDHWVIQRPQALEQPGCARPGQSRVRAHRPASRARPRASPPLLFPPTRPAIRALQSLDL